MKRLNLIWRRLSNVAFLFAFWLGMHADAWAAKLPKKEASSGGGGQTWVAPYALVMLAIGLGMLFVVRSSRRADRAKPQEYKSVTKST